MTAAQSPAQPPSFYASAKPTPSILETRLYPPPRNVPSLPLLARFQFYARHFWSPTLTPFPISFFHFPLPHPLWRHNSATIVRIQSNFQLETRIFADGRRPKVYRSHSSRCFLLIESSYVTCARGCTRLIKPRVNSARFWQTFQRGFWIFEDWKIGRYITIQERSMILIIEEGEKKVSVPGAEKFRRKKYFFYKEIFEFSRRK